ncbi:MAG TPA: hypothetical protein PKC18_12730 [Lacipirellulaceae bacterium]|nr:hypothetical protein [Lacipirellulaceae bacterium]HMP05863.1 hypothetical protein [Lacipirellulaceae bacterium]
MAARRAAAALAIMSCLFATPGCGNRTGRQEVSGTVTIDGQPLQRGEISLRPVEKGPSAAGRIQNGQFTLDSRKGPLPGAYTVTIESYEETGRMIALVDSPGTKVPELRQSIPARYNDQTELRIEVTSSGRNEFNFELQKN